MSVAAAHSPSRSAVSRYATERSLALASIGLVGLHVVDDNFLQPEPGMTAVDHLPGGLTLLALVAAGAWAYTGALVPVPAPPIALLLGFLGVLAGIEAVYYTVADSPSGDDFTGFLSLVARLRPARHRRSRTLWRARRTDDSRRRRYLRRGLVLAGVVVLIPTVPDAGLDRVLRHAHPARRPSRPRTSVPHRRTSPSRRATGSGSRAGSSRRGTAPP